MLVKNLMMSKTENLEMSCYIKELHEQMKEQGLSVPPQKKSEALEDDHDDEEEDESDDSDSDFTDSDDDRKPAPGNGLLEQIFNIQT